MNCFVSMPRSVTSSASYEGMVQLPKGISHGARSVLRKTIFPLTSLFATISPYLARTRR